MRREYFLFYLSPLLLVVVAVGALQLVTERGRVARSRSAGELLAHEVETLIASEYVLPTDSIDLGYGAAEGMAATLDRYCKVYRPDRWEKQKLADEGRYVGIGIRSWIVRGRVTIVQVARGGPAERAGVRVGDAILAVDGEALPEKPDLAAVSARIRGDEDSVVHLDLLAWDGGPRRTLEIVRGTAETETAYGSLLPAHPHYAYLRLTAFKENTPAQFDRTLDALRVRDLQGVVIDVRGNRGGVLAAAVRVADRFLREGRIVSTVGRHGEEVWMAEDVREDVDVPLAVLADGGSASASEVLVGALQDHGRGVVVGQRTFGKGVVQGVFQLRHAAGGIKLTTAHYFTPAGRCIERQLALGGGRRRRGGLQPDLVVGLAGEQARWASTLAERRRYPAFIQAALAGEGGDMPDGFEDPQLEAALGLLAGRGLDVPVAE